jgi:cytochrome c oxidase assembly protein subunit 15
MMATPREVDGFLRYAWTTLGVTLLVIVWGAVVRATGSGAGCGSHWPLCNGAVVPLEPTVATTIEFVHRVTSGAVMVMAVWLVVAARRTFEPGHQVRRWATISLIFMLIEAAIGAGIVLLELVADNASATRAFYVGGHLVNTLLLVGAITTTLWWAAFAKASADPRTRGPADPHPRTPAPSHPRTLPLSLCLIGMLVVASTGAVVALGDTLFPHASLAEGIAADFDPTSHFLIRLRIWHPIAAVVLAAGLLWLAWVSPVFQTARQAMPRRLVIGAVLTQSALGVVNLLLLAPLPLQMAHLLFSNLLWIPLVWAWWNARIEMPKV